MTVHLVIAFLRRFSLMFAHMCMSVSMFGDNYIIKIKPIPYSSFWYMHNYWGVHCLILKWNNNVPESISQLTCVIKTSCFTK